MRDEATATATEVESCSARNDYYFQPPTLRSSERKQLAHTENRAQPNLRIFAYLFCSEYSALRLLCSSHKRFGSTLSRFGEIIVIAIETKDTLRSPQNPRNLFMLVIIFSFELAQPYSPLPSLFHHLALPLLSDVDAAGG